MIWQIISRWDALDRGMKHFFTGKPCRNFGNVWLRNTNRGKCVCPDCKKQRREKGYSYITEEDMERKRQYARDRRQADVEAAREKARNYKKRARELGLKKPLTDAQKERQREYQRKYQKARKQKDPITPRVNSINNRVKNKYPDQYNMTSELDDFILRECVALASMRGEFIKTKWHIDHMVPLARGGIHEGLNLQVIPASINILKKDRMVFTQPFQWIKALSFFV